MSILKIKDSQGNWVGVPTVKGDTGNGISSAILNDDYTLTLTFTDGTTYTTPSIRGEKGEQGEPATDMDIHICSASEYDSETRIPTITSPDDKTFYLVPTEDGTSPDLFTEWVYVNNAWEMFGSASVDLSGYLTDVQIDGNSVVTDGVASIPFASDKNFGITKIGGNSYGLITTGTNILIIRGAKLDETRLATHGHAPIVPNIQHASTFYGLAKASGDTTQSQSDNPIGTYTDEAKASIQTMLDVPSKSDIPEVKVDDVQINGTSIVENGVANVPIASGTTLGAVRYASGYGATVNAEGFINIAPATINLIKSPSVISASRMPITPSHQHESTFYGLAKASGDTTQSASSNAVGNYTDNAKSSIQNMLGITDKYSPKEWVAESETELVTNAHNIGDLFYIGETLYKVIADLNAGDAVNVGVNVEEVNVNDILDDCATKEDVQDNVSIVEKSASGSIASFPDGADGIPLKSLVVDINPVQDLHGYDSPWVGGGGKNLLAYPYETASGTSFGGLTVTYDDKGIITINGTKTANGSWSIQKVLLTAGTYTLSIASPLLSGLTLRAYDTKTGTTYATVTNSFKTFVLTKDTEITFYFLTQSALTGDVNLTVKIQVEEGSTATDWTPYENICPISGWTGCEVSACGINLFDKSVDISANNYYYNATGEKVTASSYCSTDFIKIKGGTTYFWAINGVPPIGNASHNAPRVAYFDKDKRWLSSGKVLGTDGSSSTAPSNAVYVVLPVYTRSQTAVDKAMFVEGSTLPTTYVPYTGTLIPISWQTEAGTVYGGKLDVLSGVLRVERVTAIYDGTETYTNTYFPTVVCIKALPTGKGGGDTFLCSHLPTGTYYADFSNSAKRLIQFSHCNTVWNVASADELKAKIAEQYANGTPVTFVYPLAEPIEIQLTPHEVNSILGTNNIFADTGDTEVEYFSQVDEDLVDYIKANLNSYAKKDLLNNYVNDVQVDGTSIVENGIAEIPLANTSTAGVVKINNGYGIITSPNGELFINTALNSDAQIGTNINKPITPYSQHASVFYGLAKASGVDEKDSTLPLGTYTDEAKTAIKQMLGIHDTIDSFVEEVSGTDVTITGQPSYRYNCGELYSLTVTPPSSGTIDIRFTSGSTPTVLTLPSTVKMPEWWVEVEANTTYEMCITDGIYCGVMTWAI